MALSLDRPVRERKSVERLVASIEKEPAKGFRIEKGLGTPLKEIPNVAYKLSKKKTDETFKSLYMILFGRRGKASDVKKNISQFSGFVWHENEEKQRMKLKEKFDKCVKEKLLEFCDVLDISVVKTTTRKEDIVVKLIDFLASPHAMTDVLLAEKEQPSKTRKRKRSVKGSASKSGGSSAKHSSGKRIKSGDTPKGTDKRSDLDTGDESEEEDEENDNGVPDAPQEVLDHSENEDKEDESVEESEEDTRKRKRSSKKSSSKKESAGKTDMKKCTTSTKATPTAPPKKTPSKSSSKHSKVDDSIDKSPKVFSRKKKNEETKKKASTTVKSATKDKAGSKVVKGKDKSREGEPVPSEDELRSAICEILKEVDFNTATFTDILKLLARRFSMDLTPRKSAIKLLIQEELTKLADEAEDNEDDDGEGDEKEDQPTAGQEVEA
ncbi:myb-like protein V isoform X5 [Telopea speciosissima]|nr:myb-like protein V isoform X5 [Telopea speciosissima]